MYVRLARTAMVLGICAALASTANAQRPEKGKGKGKGKRKNDIAAVAMDAVFGFPADIDLSADQSKKLEGLKKEYGPKIEAAAKKADENAVLTPEQLSKRQEARRTARSEGKTGKDLRAAVESAASLTDDQIKKLDAARQELRKLQASTREKVVALLTDEQKSKIKPITAKKKKKDKAA